MEWVKDFFITNFILICVAIMMLVNSIQRFKQHPRISFYSILIISTALFLAVSATCEAYGKSIGNSTFTLVFSIFGYSLRPVCIFLFVLLSGRYRRNKWLYLATIPLIINLLIYCLGFIPGIREQVVYFIENDDGTCSFQCGPLRYTSHIISAGYFIWLLYISLSMVRVGHLSRGFTILGCALFVVAAVVIESFFNQDGDIYLLNATIAVSAMLYYLYLYIEKTQIDTLTGTYNRETYYLDAQKMKNITGVIQFDMNGLKYINDNYGHFEGDKALSTIASIILKSANRKMYVYRIGGDEFILLATDCYQKELEDTINKFRETMGETTYHCSVGFAFKTEKNESLKEMMKIAEKNMYLDKEEYYKTSGIERRR